MVPRRLQSPRPPPRDGDCGRPVARRQRAKAEEGPSTDTVYGKSTKEAFTCLIALLAFLALGNRLDWSLALPLAIGALLSVPVATITIKGLKESTIRAAIGGLTLGLGLLSLWKLLL